MSKKWVFTFWGEYFIELIESISSFTSAKHEWKLLIFTTLDSKDRGVQSHRLHNFYYNDFKAPKCPGTKSETLEKGLEKGQFKVYLKIIDS